MVRQSYRVFWSWDDWEVFIIEAKDSHMADDAAIEKGREIVAEYVKKQREEGLGIYWRVEELRHIAEFRE